MPPKPLAAYIGNFYGKCDLQEKCACLNAKHWHGTLCSHWKPFTASTWEELMQKVKADYAAKEARTGTVC